MTYAIIADWDDQNRVTRYNHVETEAEAQVIVDRLHGVGSDALPLAKQAPNAYYVDMPVPPAGHTMFKLRATYWTADPVTKTMTYNTPALHAYMSARDGRRIDKEADKRIDKAISPDNPRRAGRVREEMPEGPAKVLLITKIANIRTAAEALKNSLVTKTPEEIKVMDVREDTHWPA